MTRKLLFMNEKIEPKILLRNLKSRNSSLLADKNSKCLNHEQLSEISSRLSCSSMSQKENESNTSRPNSCFLFENQTSISRNSSSNLNETLIRSNSSLKNVNRIVTSFDELCELKPGSRIPIDIQNPNSQNQFVSNIPNNINKTNSNNRETSFRSMKNFNNLLSYTDHNLNDTESTINFSKLLINANKNKSEISYKMNLTTSNDEELPTPVNNSNGTSTNTINRKYFSFLTTNKLFSSSLSINEPKLRVHNNQLIDENDLKQRRMSNTQKEEILDGLSTSPSTSSTSTTNSDSGCGCSIARSSILSNLDQNDAHIEPLTLPISSNFEYSSSRSSPLSSHKIESDSSSDFNTNSDQFNVGKCKKVLTILFDYVSNGFKVKKNDIVKIIRDYDENLYLVAVISNGAIGFIPKEYTVDLEEIKQRVAQNQNAFLGQEKLIKNCSNFSFNSRFNSIEKNFNFKLTKL